MSQGTSFNELYATLGALVLTTTGRIYKKGFGLRVTPKEPYCVIILSSGRGVENPVVENVLLDTPDDNGKIFQQIPWGTLLIDCEVRFLKSGNVNTALEAATQFKNSLNLEERAFDIQRIMGIVNPIEVKDISTVFRSDIEPRVGVHFRFYANVSLPYSLGDNNISEIESQSVNIEHISQNETSTEINVVIDKP